MRRRFLALSPPPCNVGRACTRRVLLFFKLFFPPPSFSPLKIGTLPQPTRMACMHRNTNMIHLGKLVTAEPLLICTPSQVLLVVAVLRLVYTGPQTAPLVIIRIETCLPR